MNIARTICSIHNQNVGRNLIRKFRFTATKYDSNQAKQPQVKEEKFDFEDIQAFERTERRKAKIPPFMKDIFVSVFNRDMLAYPEILNQEEQESLNHRISALDSVFSDPKKTQEDRKNALKATRMYAGPVSLTKNGLAINHTESLRYLETISSDLKLSVELSDHWVCLQALKLGLMEEEYNKIIDDLVTGDRLIAICVKEKLAERLKQADFRTSAELDGHDVWRITGEKVCTISGGYYLVLALVEAERLKAFLVHPGAEGMVHDGNYVSFLKTPAVPLNAISDASLAHTLASSRLYSATLTRQRLKQALQAAKEYVEPRVFSGKPLSELSTIRATIGDAYLNIYASESAEYFTAALMDGYEQPDAEIECAMCRNFIANHGLQSILKLTEIPSLDKEEECKRALDEMRHLAARGESLFNVNTFIALNGIHHAGKMMSSEIKAIRNPLYHPSFILKKVFADRHQEADNPKLTLFLSEHLHPSLRPVADQLEYCVLRMRYACEAMMSRHGMDVGTAFTELERLAEAGTEILVMTAVLARASRAYCIGLRNADNEMKMASCFVEMNKFRVKKLIKEIDDGEYINLDHFKVQFGRKILENNFDIEKPIARVFW